MSLVINESEIFKYVVLDEDEEDRTGAKQNAKKLLNRVPINIFENEYYILYKAVEQASKYNIPLSYDHFHQMLLANIDEIVQSGQVDMLSDGDYTDAERADKIVDMCLMEFDLLAEADREDDNVMLANLEYYIDVWGKRKIREITVNQLDIIDEGLRVGRRLYRGVVDSKAYYDKAYQVVRTLMEADAGALAENIDTSRDSTEEIRGKMSEGGSQPVAKTGIKELDLYYEFTRGEIVTIQAGTGVGKTRFATNIGYHGLRMGSNVLYISLEQKSGRIFPMIEARHILETFGDYPDMDDRSIIKEIYSFEREPIRDEAITDLRENPDYGRIRIEGRSMNANELYNFMEQVWEDGFHFDILVLDYIGLLETEGEGRYAQLTEAINMLKSQCKNFKGRGFLGVVPNQLSTDAEEKLEANDYESGVKTGGSETQYIARGSDYIFTLWQSDIMRVMSEMGITVEKVRLGEVVKKKVKAIVDLGKIMFMDMDDEEEEEY